MIPTEFAPITSHIWQSTLFAAVAVLLTLALRRNRARVRYVVLLAASYKFLLPFSWLVSLGREFQWRTAPAALPHAISAVTDAISAPTFLTPTVSAKPLPDHIALLPWVIGLVWGCGSLIIAVGWVREWCRLRSMVRTAQPLPFNVPIPVLSTSSHLEPGVFGIFRPVLLLPEDIAEKLSPAQLRVVLAHELCHVRRRDNLAAAMHVLVEALFWFHPLVWWLDCRIVEERERACDEEVLRMGDEPAGYAETILAVCKSYVESPMACMSGISGADLKKRVTNVMANHRIENLGPARKLLLAAVGVVAIVAPIVFGIINAPLLQAQSGTTDTQEADAPSFEVASIKKHQPDPPGKMGMVRIGPPPGDVSQWVSTNITAKQLISMAYSLKNFQIEGGPSWLDSERFDVDAKVDDSVAAQLQKLPFGQQREQMSLMLRPLLANRFKLQITRSSKEGDVLALVVAKGGSRLKEVPPPDPSAPPPPGIAITPDHLPTPPPGQSYVMMMNGFAILSSNAVPIAKLVDQLSGALNKQVVDQTSLRGTYQYALKYDPQLRPEIAPAEAEAPSGPELLPIFSALQDQLGLKLEPTKGEIDMITIDHIEEPAPN